MHNFFTCNTQVVFPLKKLCVAQKIIKYLNLFKLQENFDHTYYLHVNALVLLHLFNTSWKLSSVISWPIQFLETCKCIEVLLSLVKINIGYHMSSKVIFYHLRDDSAGKGCGQGGLANIFSKSNFHKEKRPKGDKMFKSSTKWNCQLCSSISDSS